ncbi:MAG: hypothetical protein HPY81_05735 [Firmicutes bacterium]|nr:hypothetical protein [Bacillota bacterium]
MPDFAVVRPVKLTGQTSLGRLISGRIMDLAVLIGKSRRQGIRTYQLESGEIVKEHILACPFPRREVLVQYENKVINHLVAAGHLAERFAAKVIGYDPMILWACDLAGKVAPGLQIPIISGELMRLVALKETLQRLLNTQERLLNHARVMVISLRQRLTRLAAELLAPECRELIIVEQPDRSVDSWLARVLYTCGVVCQVTPRVERVLTPVDVVILGDLSVYPGEIKLDNGRPDTIVIDLFPWTNRPRLGQSINNLPILAEPVFCLRQANGETEAAQMALLDPLEAELLLATLERNESVSIVSREIRPAQVVMIQRLMRKYGFKLMDNIAWEKKEVLDKGRPGNYNSD